MLGQFLEFSTPAHPVSSALEFYRSLGFEELTSGDILPWPYAPVWDGSATIGLQDVELGSLTLTFVRPQLKAHLYPLRRAGIELQYSQLADDRFNQAAFLDPNGQLIVLLEARTFSPATWETSNIGVCGEFLEFSLPTHSVAESQEFWSALNFRTIDESRDPHPWIRMAGCGLVVGFHQSARFAAGLSFRCNDLEARIEYLKAKGIGLDPRAPTATGASFSATVRAPDGTSLYLVEEPAPGVSLSSNR